MGNTLKLACFRVLQGIGRAGVIEHEPDDILELDPEDPNTVRLLRIRAIEGPIEDPRVEDPDAEARKQAEAEAAAKAKAEADAAAKEAEKVAEERRTALKGMDRAKLEAEAKQAGVAGISTLNMDKLVDAIVEKEAANAAEAAAKAEADNQGGGQ